MRDCDQTLDFLEGLTESYHIIKLRSFEVAINEDEYLQTYYENNKPHPIESFLLSFQGLEEISISVSNTFHPVNPITNPICHHRATLRRLVYHEEGYEIHRESEGPLAWEQFINRVVEGMDLECIGFCLSPSLLVRLAFHRLYYISILTKHSFQIPRLERSIAAQTVKLLHFRETGCVPHTNALFGFANWAFGPQGLHNLLVIAHGDFSHGNRFERTQILMGRNSEQSSRNFRVISHDQRGDWLNQIDGAHEILCACPQEVTLGYGHNLWNMEVESDMEEDFYVEIDTDSSNSD